eukprot:COSAG02_NODE_10850_length_1846_cov_1.447624_4_plen_56_part_00
MITVVIYVFLIACVAMIRSEQERKAHRARKKSAKMLKKPCPLISERLLATGFMVE